MVCLHCGYFIISIPTSKKDPADDKRYKNKRWEAFRRRKEYLECPKCDGKMLEVDGNFEPYTEEEYDKVKCTFCGCQTHFKKCKKDLVLFSPCYVFHCAPCIKMSYMRMLFLLAAVLGFIAVIFQL